MNMPLCTGQPYPNHKIETGMSGSMIQIDVFFVFLSGAYAMRLPKRIIFEGLGLSRKDSWNPKFLCSLRELLKRIC